MLNQFLKIEQSFCKGIHSISTIFLDNAITICNFDFGNFFLVIIPIGDVFSVQKQGFHQPADLSLQLCNLDAAKC